jgi:hypothetical protein
MTEVINLRQARKHRARDDKRAKGDANAAKFGESKPLRDARKSEAERVAKQFEAHKRDD